jgi:partner of Y14 and mago protein
MSSSSSTPTTPSRSGITTDAAGQRLVASSTRADGTQRKEIKIRPGYRPQEDVEVYKNRTAQAWKTRGSGGVPGAASAEDEPDKGTTASNKNAKRREARKKAKAAEDEQQGKNGKDETKDSTNNTAVGTEKDDWRQTEPVKEPHVDVEAENEKKIKRLKKRLREAKELRAKKESGQGLLHEQFEKVIKINELMRDLEKLGVKDEDEEKAVVKD